MIALAMREKGGFVPTCDECRADPRARERNGCVGGIRGRDQLWCPRCEGERGNRACPQCRGTGYLQLARCPVPEILQDLDLRNFLFYVDMIECHLPAAGGLADQSQRFLSAARFALRVKRALAKEEG
ncbi:MAG: hypothetical protein ACYTED_20460 [Planctomycetota bacterium]|jgi:hypothetical protein